MYMDSTVGVGSAWGADVLATLGRPEDSPPHRLEFRSAEGQEYSLPVVEMTHGIYSSTGLATYTERLHCVMMSTLRNSVDPN